MNIYFAVHVVPLRPLLVPIVCCSLYFTLAVAFQPSLGLSLQFLGNYFWSPDSMCVHTYTLINVRPSSLFLLLSARFSSSQTSNLIF